MIQLRLILIAILIILTSSVRAQQWLPGGAGQPMVCSYSTSPPTIASGLLAYVQCGNNTGSLSAFVANALAPGIAAPSGSSPVVNALTTGVVPSTSTLGTSLVVDAAPGNLTGFYCTAIAGGAAGYCIAYNGTTAPGTGALTATNVLDACYFDTTPRGCSINYLPSATRYSTGIVILVSSATTPYTYTTGTDTAYIKGTFE